MELTEQNIKEIIKADLQPKVRVDGGDIEFERLEDKVIYIGAHAECATCPASPERLQWWCEQEFEKAFGRRCTVIITNHIPYFKQ